MRRTLCCGLLGKYGAPRGTPPARHLHCLRSPGRSLAAGSFALCVSSALSHARARQSWKAGVLSAIMAHAQRRCSFTYLIFLGCLGCLGSPTPSFAVESRRVFRNVALHAQRPPSPQAVVGSAVTMAGVRQALLRRDWKRSANATTSGRKDSGGSTVEGGRWSGEGAKITQQEEDQPHVRIFYPFNYEGLHARSWDLVIIEGWFGMINSFIHEVRQMYIEECRLDLLKKGSRDQNSVYVRVI